MVTVPLAGDKSPVQVSFESLPARPMVSLVLEPAAPNRGALVGQLASRLRELDPDSVVRVQLRGPNAAESLQSLSAACLRDLAPPTMNIALAPASFHHPRQSQSFQV